MRVPRERRVATLDDRSECICTRVTEFQRASVTSPMGPFTLNRETIYAGGAPAPRPTPANRGLYPASAPVPSFFRYPSRSPPSGRGGR